MSAFTKVPSIKPGRSVFNLSYQKQFDCDFGELIPVCLEEMVPGDTFKLGNEIVVRMHPLNAPVLAEVNAYVHYFFVPTRIIWDGWEDFITGGEYDPTQSVDGLDPTPLPRFAAGTATDEQAFGPYSLYDYFGMPLIYTENHWSQPGYGLNLPNPGYYYRPLAFPWYVYNLVWNEYYRDETLQDEVGLGNVFVLKRNWAKDYFTSALPWQQKGTSPALPISGEFPAYLSSSMSEIPVNYLCGGGNGSEPGNIEWNNTGSTIPISSKEHKVMVNIADAATFDVSDLRLAFQVQRWMERNAISGSRYTEFLHAHYGVSPRDDRLQRPEYLGGSKSPILISEVVQTSSNAENSPQGTLRGKGITADRNFIASYTAKEFGYIIGIMSIMPKPGYFQGVDRKWLRSSRFDFYSPEFARLSEQAVTNEEVFALPGDSKDSVLNQIGNGDIFGYQARFNEMRQNHDVFCGELRPNRTLGYWNLGRYFDSLPQLNSDFITMNATNDHLKRIFAVQNVKGLIVNFANIITAIRPLPKYGEPGLIDHV